MSYFHVMLQLRDEPDKDRCVFSDLSEKELRTRFLLPYRRGQDFLSGNEVIDTRSIRKTTIVRTDQPSVVTLKRIQEKSTREMDELNRGGDVVFFGLGRGYDAEDIAEGGDDVTASYIVGPPGQGDRWALVSAVLNHPWVSAIGTGLIVGALIWLFGLT